MKKFIVFISILALIVMVPTGSAFAGKHVNSHNHVDIETGDIGCGNTNNGIIAGGDVGSGNTNNGVIGGDQYNGGITNEGGNVGDINNDQDVNVNFNEAEVTTTNVNVNGKVKGYRGFANPAEVSYAPLPGYFGAATRNANVQSVKTIVMFKNTFTRADVNGLVKGISVDANSHVPALAKEDQRDTDMVTVIFMAPDKSTVRQFAVITTKATSKEATSVDVLAAAILSALDIGADLLYVTAEGAASELRSFGWGIGLAYTHATISTDERSGGVSSGGLGVSGGKAGYKSFPWIQTIALGSLVN